MSTPSSETASGPPYRIAHLGGSGGSALLAHDPELVLDHFDELPALLATGRRLQPRVCVVDTGGGEGPVAETVRAIRRELPLTDVVFWAPGGDAEFVRHALLSGARDALVDGDRERLTERVREVVEDQTLLPRMLEEDRSAGTHRFGDLVSRSKAMWDVFETCARTATTDASVLILGETGTGKELIAREIHRRSGRKGRFVPVNCGAVPDTLIDSELFGHVEGAFTGARKAREGLFRHAEGGTLFLDEIGNIPMDAQNRLLRTLQEGTVRPVGGNEELPVDVRVIAATSVPLELEIDEQRFREDLFYRIDVIRLILPPLRERPEDLILLLGRFVHESAIDYSVRRPEIGEEFLDRVCDYNWPGNVRELENFVERLVLTNPGERLTERHFDELMRNYTGRDGASGGASEDRAPTLARIDLSRPLPDVVAEASEEIERRYLEAALRESGGRVGEAARRAGIHRRTMLRKLQHHGMDKRDYRA